MDNPTGSLYWVQFSDGPLDLWTRGLSRTGEIIAPLLRWLVASEIEISRPTVGSTPTRSIWA